MSLAINITEAPPSPRTHMRRLSEVHEERFKKIQDILAESFSGCPTAWALATTGSDGRIEARGSTPFEVCVILDPAVSPLGCSDLREVHSSCSHVESQTPTTEEEGQPLNWSMAMPPSPEVLARSFVTDEARRFPSDTPTVDTSAEPVERSIIAYTPAQRILDTLRGIIAQDEIFFSKLMVIDPTDSRVLTISAKGSHRVVSPGYSLELVPMFGNVEIAQNYRKAAEVALPALVADERHNFRFQVLEPAKRELDACLRGEHPAVCLETGALHYDRAKLMSVKYPLMRPIQYHLMWLLMHIKGLPSVQEGRQSAESLLQDMPRPILSRMEWMYGQGFFPKMSPDALEELRCVYNTLLFWYGKSQEAFEQKCSTIYVDPKQLQEAAQYIHTFIDQNTKLDLSPKKLQRKTPVINPSPK